MVFIMASSGFICFILIQTCILGIWVQIESPGFIQRPPLSVEKYSMIYITRHIFPRAAVRRWAHPSSLE